jgi:hypothetical protein
MYQCTYLHMVFNSLLYEFVQLRIMRKLKLERNAVVTRHISSIQASSTSLCIKKSNYRSPCTFFIPWPLHPDSSWCEDPLEASHRTLVHKLCGACTSAIYCTSAKTELSVWKDILQCKKKFAVFPSLDGMSPTKLPLAGNNLIIPGRGHFGEWLPGWRRENHWPFLQSIEGLAYLWSMEVLGWGPVGPASAGGRGWMIAGTLALQEKFLFWSSPGKQTNEWN